jgi:hypothetical protein
MYSEFQFLPNVPEEYVYSVFEYDENAKKEREISSIKVYEVITPLSLKECSVLSTVKFLDEGFEMMQKMKIKLIDSHFYTTEFFEYFNGELNRSESSLPRIFLPIADDSLYFDEISGCYMQAKIEKNILKCDTFLSDTMESISEMVFEREKWKIVFSMALPGHSKCSFRRVD